MVYFKVVLLPSFRVTLLFSRTMPWTVTAQDASCPPTEVAVTAVSPAATPVTRPVSLTVATAELAVRQVTVWSALSGVTEALSCSV